MNLKSVLYASALMCIFLTQSGIGQVTGVSYQMRYNTTSCRWDCYIIIEEGSATSAAQRVQTNSQYSIVVPTGTTLNVAQNFMPLNNNQTYTGTIPLKWAIASVIDAPAVTPTRKYYGITPTLSPTSFYNNLATGDTVRLFSVSITPTLECGDNIWIFRNGVDPDSSQPGMEGGDFSNGFGIGSPDQIYLDNLPQVNPPLPILDAVTACSQGVEINLTATTSTCQSPLTYAWTGPDGYSGTTQDVAINPATESNAGIYKVVVTDTRGCQDSLEINAPVKPLAGADQTACASGSATLTSTGPSTGTWTVDGTNPTGAILGTTTGGIASVDFTATAEGIYKFIYTAGPCSDTMQVEVILPDGGPDPDPVSCFQTGTATMSAVGTGVWSLSNTSAGTATITDPNDPNTTVTGFSVLGTYVLEWTVGTCVDIVEIVVGDNCTCLITGNGLSPVSPATYCGTSGVITINGGTVSPPGGTYTWEYSLNGAIFAPASGSNGVEDYQTPNHTSGTHRYRRIYFLAGDPVCLDTSNIVQFIVNPNPGTPAPITASPNPNCLGTVITLTANNNAGATYEWTTSVIEAGLVNSTSHTTTMNPTLPGTYVISVTQTIAGCISPVATISVTTEGVPLTPSAANITANNPVACNTSSGSILFSGMEPNTSYQLEYFRNNVLQSAFLFSDENGIITLNALSAGSYTNFKFTNAAGCDSGVYAGPVELTDPSAPDAPQDLAASPNPTCANTTITLTVTNTPGATYTWTADSPLAGLIPSTTRTAFMVPTASGFYNIEVTQTVAGCTSLPSSIGISVNSSPPTPTSNTVTSTNPSACGLSNGSIRLSGLSNNTSYTITYNYNGSPMTANVASNGSGIATILNLASGSYTNFRLGDIAGCLSGTYAGPVNLTDPATPSAPAGLTAVPNPVCMGTIVNLSVTNNAGATYTWTATPTGSGLVTSTSNSTTMNPTAAGTYTINVTQTIAGCTSLPATTNVTVNPTPPTPNAGTVSSVNPAVCGASTGSISFAGLLSNTAYTIQYTRDGSPLTANVTTNASGIATITGLNAATYASFRIVNAFNCGSGIYAGPVVISDPSAPSAPAILTANPNPVCVGIVVALSVTPNAGATYTWTASSANAGLVTSTTSGTTMSTMTSGTYTISVTQTVAGCTSPASSVEVLVNPAPPTPTAGSISSTNPSVCAGSDATISLSGLVANTSYTINYTRNNVPQTASVTTNGSGVAIITGLDAGNYSGFRITNSGGCSSGTYNGVVGLSDPGSPSAPANLTANPNPSCIGTTVNLSVTNNAGAVYTWSSNSNDAGLVLSSTNTTTMLATVPGNYTISVIQNVAGCTSPAANVVVNVNPIPPSLTASNVGNTNPTSCGGTQGSIILSGLPSNTTYTLNYSINNMPTTVSVTTDGTGSAIISNLSAGVYTNFSLTGTGGCTGGAYAGPVTLTDPTSPSAPIGLVANPNPVCLGTMVNLSVTNNAAATYSWSVSSANAGLVLSSTNSTTMMALSAGTYTVSVTQMVAGCISPAATVEIIINPLPPTPTAGSISSVNPTTCLGSDGSISISGYAANTTYTLAYTKDNAPVSVSLTTNGFGIITINNLTAGVYSNFRITNAQGCSSGVYTGQITLSDPPSQGTPINLAANPDPSCLGTLVNLSVTNEAGATYTWSVSSAGTAGLSASNSNITSMLATAPSIYTVSVTKTVAGCVSSPATVTVTVNPVPRTPDANNFSVVNPTCGDSNGSITINGLVPNESQIIEFLYNGNPESVSVTSDVNGMATLTGYAAGLFTNFRITNTFGCNSEVYAGPVELTDPGLPVPPTGFISNPPQICIKGVVTLSVDNNPGATYNWNASNPGAGLQSSTSNTTTMQPLASGFYTISVTQTVNGCTSPPSTLVVEVKGDCYNPDFDVTFVDIPLDGNVSTNDSPDAFTEYTFVESQGGNPSSCVPALNSDGTYTFVCNTAGKYNYMVSACSNENSSTCVNTLLSITVLEPMSTNNPPIANPDYIRTQVNSPIEINILSNDKCQSASNCTLTNLSVSVNPLYGTFNVNTRIYTPNNNFIGQDSFRYNVCQNPLVSMNNCADAWVYVTILSGNVRNVTNAMDDYGQTPLNTVLVVSAANGLLANDSDFEGHTQSVIPMLQTIPNKGILDVRADGSYTFTPDNGFIGPVFLPCEVCDDANPQACDWSTLHILVEPSVPRATIGDRVWHDQNGDGIQNNNESGIANVVVKLFTASGTLVSTTTTNSVGNYTFENIIAGSYYLQFVAPDDYDFTFSNRGDDALDSDVISGKIAGATSVFAVIPGETNLTYDAGLYRCSRIGDKVWYDINRNDVWDTNENGINEIEVYLWRNHFGVWLVWDVMRTGPKPNSASDDGHFEFCVPPGQYYVEVKMPPLGLVQALPNRGNNRFIDSDLNNSNGIGTTPSFSLSSGQHKLDIGAGFYPMAVAGNLVWLDLNQNGIQEANEPSVAGVSVYALDSETHDQVGSSTTDVNGFYKIDYLQKKEIYYRFDVPPGYSPTIPNATFDALDSDVNHANGPNTTRSIKMQSGVVNENIDLGIMFGVLPVDWIYVNAKRKDNLHHITWATQKEVNVSHYQLERRLNKDGSFEPIGESIQISENSSQIKQYEAFDYDTEVAGIYYYRVKQVDFDGKFTYSDIVYVSFTSDSDIVMYPSPAVDESNLEVNLEIASNVEIQLFDASARLIQKVVNKELEEGGHAFKLDLNGLKPGVYNVLVNINGQKITKKLIKIE